MLVSRVTNSFFFPVLPDLKGRRVKFFLSQGCLDLLECSGDIVAKRREPGPVGEMNLPHRRPTSVPWRFCHEEGWSGAGFRGALGWGRFREGEGHARC